MLVEYGRDPGIAIVDDAANLGIDHLADVLRVVFLLADVATQEDHLVFAAERHRPETLAHPALLDHLADDGGGALDIVAAAGAHITEDDSLSGVTAYYNSLT